jgi:hypothetical protein
MELSVGSVSPTFEAVVTIDEREKPRMLASGEGDASSSSFEMSSGMELSETEAGGVAVEWWAEADVFGRIAQMGQRVINPVANRVVKRFFNDVQSQLQDLALTEDEDEAAATSDSEAVAGADGESGGTTGSPRKSKQQSSGGILARIKQLLGLGG